MIVIFFFEIGLLLPSFKIDPPPFPPSTPRECFYQIPLPIFWRLDGQSSWAARTQTENTRVILVVRDVITVIRGV